MSHKDMLTTQPEINTLPQNEIIDPLQGIIKRTEFQEAGERIKQGVLEIVLRNNKIAEIIRSPELQAQLEREKELIGTVKLGAVDCIDGRKIRAWMLGFKINEWSTPAALLEILTGRLDSVSFNTILKNNLELEPNRGILEFLISHRSSILNHDCGRVKKGQGEHERGFSTKIATAILSHQLIEKRIAPAVTKKINEIRAKLGLPPLKTATVSISFDTDTYGIDLQYLNKKGSLNENKLSTTSLLQTGLADKIERKYGQTIGQPGCVEPDLENTDKICDVYTKIVNVTEVLMRDDELGLNTTLETYINDNYSDLTPEQKQGLKFYVSRTIAFQYLSGFYQFKTADDVHHAYAHHGERYIGTSNKGKLPGRFDISQVFKIALSNTRELTENIELAVGLLDGQGDHGPKEPYYVFLGEPRNRGDWESRKTTHKEQMDRALIELGNSYRILTRNKTIRKLMTQGKIIIVPVFTDETDNSILEVLDLDYLE